MRLENFKLILLLRFVFLPLIDFDVGFANEVPIIINDEPVVKRIFRPGILIFFSINYLIINNCDIRRRRNFSFLLIQQTNHRYFYVTL